MSHSNTSLTHMRFLKSFLTFILLSTLTVFDPVNSVHIRAERSFILVFTVTVRLSSYRDCCGYGRQKRRKFWLWIRVAVLPRRKKNKLLECSFKKKMLRTNPCHFPFPWISPLNRNVIFKLSSFYFYVYSLKSMLSTFTGINESLPDFKDYWKELLKGDWSGRAWLCVASIEAAPSQLIRGWESHNLAAKQKQQPQ